MASNKVTKTYGGLLELRAKMLEVRSNELASATLAMLFNKQADDKLFIQTLARISPTVNISVHQLSSYYDWFYGGVYVNTAYLFIQDKDGKSFVDSRFDTQGLPHGVRIIGLIDATGCFITGYIPDELHTEVLTEIQDILLAFWNLKITAAEINLHGYTAL